MNINVMSQEKKIEIDDFKVIKLHRDNLKRRLRQATIPIRDSLWQSTFDGKLLPHRDIKRIRKQFSFYTVDEINAHENRFKPKN